ncbi:hypothetical protein JT359_07800 [Candidatus Poribacteria bacterium]|nr:hypothetical protein [Candidatus Poribacteria bacterium]
MLNVSYERLVIDAVKGDDVAIKNLKNRIQAEAKSAVRHVLKHRRCSNAKIEDLEIQIVPQIVQAMLGALSKYNFNNSLQNWIYSLVCHYVELALNKKDALEQHGSSIDENGVTKLCYNSQGTKHPLLEQIDIEVRTLVSLLNQLSYIQTYSSCSGHPNREEWNTDKWVPYGGYIGLIPIGSVDKTINFLISLLMRLDNSCMPTHNSYLPTDLQNDATSPEAIRKRYKQEDAEALFCSEGPIVLVGISLRFFTYYRVEKNGLKIWKQLIACLRELIPEDESLTDEINTSEIALQCLQKMLNGLPFLFSASLVSSPEGYPGIVLNTQADLTICNWFSTLADRLYTRLDETGCTESNYPIKNPSFTMKWSFRLRPFLNQELLPLPHLLTPQWVPRTRECHLKIWKLLELTVAEMLNHDGC